VIGGKLRGRKLSAVPGGFIRPTADRIREAIFNILAGCVRDAFVLDLFAGTGSLGIEALSRGAKFSVFIDSSPAAHSVIHSNLKKCEIEDQARVFKWNIVKNLNCIRLPTQTFDLIFLDPPYNRGFIRSALLNIHHQGLFTGETNVIVEHSPTEPIPADLSVYGVEDQRRYGKTLVSFLKCML
jgi:16S rRNA (guanine966-N2)-methyltransferase